MKEYKFLTCSIKTFEEGFIIYYSGSHRYISYNDIINISKVRLVYRSNSSNGPIDLYFYSLSNDEPEIINIFNTIYNIWIEFLDKPSKLDTLINEVKTLNNNIKTLTDNVCFSVGSLEYENAKNDFNKRSNNNDS